VWVTNWLVIARVSGWHQLAARYLETQQNPQSVWRGWNNVTVNQVWYKSYVWVGISPQGLHLKIGPPVIFGLGHRAICIPWYALSVTAVEAGHPYAELTVTDPAVTLLLPVKSLVGATAYLPALQAAQLNASD
jgi:hypothetical protein